LRSHPTARAASGPAIALSDAGQLVVSQETDLLDALTVLTPQR